MNRRLLSALMAFCMLFTLFPVPAMGAEASGDADAWKAALSETIRDANREEFPEDSEGKFLAAPPEEPVTDEETPDEPSEPVTEAETLDEPSEPATETETPDGLTGEPDAEREISEEPTATKALAAPPEEPVTQAETPDETSDKPATQAETLDEPSEPAAKTALTSSGESADETATLLDASGSCGGNLNWSYNSYSGALTFTGSGAMKDYTSGSAPWYSYYSSIKSVSIPEGVTSIGKYAFYYCYNLTTISLPDSLDIIGEGAFSYCSTLQSLTIPESVTSFGTSVFSGCSNLTLTVYSGSPGRTYAVENSLKHKVSGDDSKVLIAGGTCGDNLLWTLDDAGTLTIEGSGPMTDYSAYSAPWYSSYASQIKTVSVSEGVTSVGKYAFYYCSALTTVSLPENSTDEDAPPPFSSIGDYAFYNCSKLDTISLPDGLTSIGYNAFDSCSALTSLAIPASVTSINYSAFNGHPSGLTLTVEPGSAGRTYAVRHGIRHYVSDNPGKLVSICGDCDEIAEGILWILDGETLTIESPLSTSNRLMNSYSNSSGSYAPWYSYGSQIKTVEIQEGLDSIGAYAFYGLDFLNKVSLPESLTHIGNYAFGNCPKLESLTIPEKASIGNSAFAGCSALTLTVSPDSAARTYAVRNGIKHIVSDNPDKVVTVSGSCGDNLMWTFDADAAALTVEGSGKMSDYSSGYAPWNSYAGKIKTVSIADGVTSIGNYAFYNCSALTDIEIPDGVESVGTGAFQNCAALESLSIPAGVAFVGSYAFSGCSNLTLTVARDSAGRVYAVKNSIKHIVSDDPDKVVTVGGVCGNSNEAYYQDNILWTLDETTGELVLEGQGAMGDYWSDSAPWNQYKSQIKTVTISDGVTSIGRYAFVYCSALTSVAIPSGVTSIGEYAFEYCSALTSVELPDSLTSIGNSAFHECSSLTSVAIPAGLTSVSGYAFQNCSALTKVTLPAALTSIGEYAFCGCSALTDVTIPDAVTSINGYAFQNCAALESLSIPAGVASFGSSVLSGCDKLTLTVEPDSAARTYAMSNKLKHVVSDSDKVVIIIASGTCGENGSNILWSLDELTGTLTLEGSGNMSNYDNYYTCAPWNSYAGQIKAVSVPEGVTSIGSYAFYGCSAMTSADIPESVASIGEGAFYDCSALTEITIPAAVTSIPSYAFQNCAALKDITIPDDVTSIGSSAFRDCAALESLTIPDGVTSIGSSAFSGCANLVLTVSRDMYARNYVFDNGLQHVAADEPDKVVTNCGKCGDSLLWLLYQDGQLTFEGSGTMYDYYSDSMPWKNCKDKIKTLTVPDGVTKIGNNAFYGASALTGVSISDDVTSVGQYAFYDCDALKALTIPASVTSIGSYAFSECVDLTLTVTRESYGRTYAIKNALKHVAADAPKQLVTDCGTCGANGDNLLWLFYEDGTLLFEGSGAMSDYSSNDLTNTAPWHSHYDKISALDIPDGVTRVGSYAFYGASKYLDDRRFMKLTTLTLPASVTSVGAYAFANCAALTSVTLSKNLSSVEQRAFSACAALTELTIPSATLSIGDNAFGDCPKLTLIVYEKSYAQEYVTANDLRHTFSGAEEDAPVILHSGKCGEDMSWLLYSNGVLQFRGSGKMYDYGKQSNENPRTTAPWNDYRDQITGVVIPEGVTKLGAYAFYGDTYYAADYRFNKLTSVNLPASLLTLGAHAFHNCASLPSISLPEGLNEIGENAFSGCDAVNELTVPKSVETIGENAFSDCANLTVRVYADSYAETYVTQNSVRHIVDGSDAVIVASGTCGDKVNWLLYKDGSLKITGSGEMWNYGQNGDIPRTTAPWYDYKDQIKSVTVAEGVTKIGAYAFYGGEYYTVNHRFANLETVTLAQSVTTLSDHAFAGCVALKTINLPDTLQRVERDAFSGCAALATLTLPQALSDIHQDAFSNCPNLTLQVYLGSASRLYVLRYNVKHSVFGSQDVVLASGVCGDNDSYGNPKLYWLVYEDGRLVFEGSGNMLDYSSNNSHTTAPWYAYHDRITSVTIPGGKDGVTKIGAYAFYGVKYYGQDYRFGKLAKVDIPESVTEIGAYAFKGCSALPSLTVYPYVDYIGEGAFTDCYNLTLTVYPDSPGKTYALQNALKHVLHGSKRTVIASGECGVSASAPLYWLFYADGVLEFEGSGDMNGFPSYRNTAGKEGLWYRSEAPWYRYRDEITSVVIPEGVASVGAHAFYGVTYYTSDHRFSKLTSVALPDSLQNIASYAFSGCVGLTSLTLPENLSVIDSYAFANDTGLKTLTIPANVSYIGENAFSGCRALTLNVHADSYALEYVQANQLRYQIDGGEIVPGADDGQPEPDPNPIPAPEHPFNVGQDAYSFVNEAKSFSYGDGILTGDKYPISYAAFKLIFGDSVAGKSKWKQSKSGVWGGNCNGLASTAALFYAGIAPLSGFNRESVYALNVGDSDGAMTVKTFVEAMQVAQYTDPFARDYQTNRRTQEQLTSGKTLDDMLERVRNDVAKGKCDIIAVGKNGVGAHAILAYNVEKVSDTEYRLYVYDCNYPGDTRYVTLTASGDNFTQWTYNMGSSYGEWGSKDSKCFVSYIPFDTVRSIWDKRGDLYQTKEMLSVNVANLSIQDAYGNEVAALQDGQLVTDSPDIYEVPELSMHWSDTNSLYLPKDLYTIVNKDSKALKASMTDLNLEAAVSTTSNNVTFAVDDASRENTVFIDGMTETDTYAVELSSSFADSQYKEFSIAGTGSAGMTGDTISISGAKDALALSSNITYQTLSINGMTKQKEDYYTIQATSGEGGAISPSGDVKVSPNETQTFTFLPKPGYKLDRVEVNGTPVDLNGRSYYDLKADTDNGATITAYFQKAYEIGSVTVDRDARTAKAANLTNLTNSVLTGVAFDKNGKFLACATQSLQAGATEGTVTFGATLPENCVVKLFLADENNKPLCAPAQ